MPVEPDPNHQRPEAMDVPVITLIGTLGNSRKSIRRIHRFFTPSGYTFQLPDPVREGLGNAFVGARYFLEIDYADRPTRRALIARDAISDSDLYLYSLNLPQSERPTEVRLKLADDAYPNMNPERSTLLHTSPLV